MSKKKKKSIIQHIPLEKRYEQMCEKYSKVEHRCNVYTCRLCGYKVKTVDEHEGVTPMFIHCDKCNGIMNSSMYRDILPDCRPTKGWYRPTFKEFLQLGIHERDHVMLGGLLLRNIKFI